MGKKKIGEIHHKPIVTGDKNLVTKNEIHESNLIGSSSNNEYEFEYLDVSGYDFTPGGTPGIIFMTLCLYSACMKIKSGNLPLAIIPFSAYEMLLGDDALNTLEPITISFAICPNMKIQGQYDGEIKLETVSESLKNMLSEYGMDYDAIPRITKEEFYDLNSSDNSGNSTIK